MLGCLVALVLSALGGAARAAPVVGPSQASVVTARGVTVRDRLFRAYDGEGRPLGSSLFREIQGTGNCCEHELAATKTGRLLDFGGTFLYQSDDGGSHWSEVTPQDPIEGGPTHQGEGSVAVAPGGEVVALGWDAYTGDRLFAYRYDARHRQWVYALVPLHAPLDDRPWVSVVPGPSGGQSWAALAEGGTVYKGLAGYSTDGLDYRPVDRTVQTGRDLILPVPQPLDDNDWDQPDTNASVTPFGGGYAVSRDPGDVSYGWLVMQPDGTYHSLAGDQPFGRMLVDSRGWIHRVDVSGTKVAYAVSTDGGQSWQEVGFSLPPGLALPADSAHDEWWDFKVNAGLGEAALAVRGLTARSGNQDLLYQLDIRRPVASVTRWWLVGRGMAPPGAGSNVAAYRAPRFDFASVAILPGGRLATSYLEDGAARPALAILE